MASILTCPSHLLAGGTIDMEYELYVTRDCYQFMTLVERGQHIPGLSVSGWWLNPMSFSQDIPSAPQVFVLLLYNQLTPSSQACIWLPILHASTSKLFRTSSDITPEFIVTWSKILTIQTTTFDNIEIGTRHAITQLNHIFFQETNSF